MNETTNTLKEVRAKYSEALTRIRAEINLLEQRASEVRVRIDTLDEVIKDVSTSNGSETPAFTGVGKYSKKSLSESIVDVVNTWGDSPGLLTPEIITKLKTEGFKSKAKKLYASVYSVSCHLANEEKIALGTKDGKRSFMRKQKDK